MKFMSNDSLIKWSLDIKNPVEMSIESLIDDNQGLKVIAKSYPNKERTIKITFQDYLTYRNTNESYLLKLWSNIPDEMLGFTFYKIDNSSYIKYFHEMSLGVYIDWEIIHYGIYTGQDCIDILATQEPSVVIEE